jgi:tetratricopeptide (TPR) repeat protein
MLTFSLACALTLGSIGSLPQTDQALDAAYYDLAHDRVSEAMGGLADHVRFEVSRLDELPEAEAQIAADELEVALIVFDRMQQTLSNDDVRIGLVGDIEVPKKFGSLYARLAWLSDSELDRLDPLLDWQVVGPFDNERGRGMVRPTAAEKEPAEASYVGKVRYVAWRDLPAVAPRGGVVRLSVLAKPAQQAAVLTRTWVHSDEAETLHLMVGATEELRIWLGGEAIYEALGEHAFGFDAHTVPLRLNEGWNELVFKVGSHEGSPYFQARLVEVDSGAPVKRACSAHAPEGVEPLKLASPGRRIKEPVAAVRAGAWRRYAQAEGAEASFRLALILNDAQPVPRSERAGSEAAEAAHQGDDSSLRYHILAIETSREMGASAVEEDINPYLTALDLALEHHGDLPWLLRKRARHAMQMQGSAQMALPWIERAVAVSPQSYLVRRDHAWIVSSLGLSARAEAMNRKWVEDPTTRVWAGVASNLTGLLPLGSKERAEWLKAGVAAGNRNMIRQQHAEQRLANQDASAQAYLDELAAIRVLAPWGTEEGMRTVRMLQSAGHLAEARALLLELLEFSPDDAAMHSLLARVAWASGDVERAVISLERSLELDFGREEERRLLQYLQAGKTTAFHEEFIEPLADILQRRELDEPLGTDAGGREILLRRVVTKVNPDGTTQVYHREVQRVLTEAGARQLDQRGFRGWPGEQEVRILEASVTHADGRTAFAETGSTGRRGYVAVDFPPLDVGDVVDLQWRNDTLKTGVFGNYFGMSESMTPSDSLYVRESDVILLAPKSFPLYLHQRNFTGQSEEVVREDDQNMWRWRLEDQRPVRQEGLMPPAQERIAQIQASSFASWTDFGTWWWNLIREELRPSPEIIEKVAELTQGAETPMDKLRAIYNFVVTDIRYNAWEFGVHGYEPYSAAVIYSRGFGDCKDKAILLKVMLAEADIEAWPVLILSEGRRFEEDHELAMVSHFNHCIAFVPEQEGIPEMFIDGTARLHNLETLPDSDAGARVLVVRGDGVENRRIRFPGGQENRLDQEIQVDLTGDAGPKVKVVRHVTGRYGVGDRHRFNGSDEERAEQAERFLSGLFGSLEGEVQSSWSAVEDLNTPMESTYEVGVESITRPTEQGFELQVTFDALNLLRGVASESERSSDLLLDVPWSRKTVIDYKLGEGAGLTKLPERVNVETGEAVYTRTIVPTDEGVRVTEYFELKTHRISKERYAEFRELCRKVDSSQVDSIEVEVKQ